jgi:hypothetical protein
LSNDIPYDARKLSSEIKNAESLASVKTLILKKIISASGVVIVLYQKNGIFYRWERKFGKTSSESNEKWVILGTRGSELFTIYSPDQFQDIFQDTLFVIDTMALNIKFNFPDCRLENYQAHYYCEDSIVTISLPAVRDNEILIYPSLFDSCNQRFISFSLLNGSAPDRELAECYLRFSTKSIEVELLSVAHGLKQNQSSLNLREITFYMQSYITLKYGKINYEQLNDWLSKNI